MFYGKSKRIIIIKDIHSNLFEEAILVLKEEHEPDDEKGKSCKMEKQNSNKNDFILKEAELVISNYIKDHKALFNGPNKEKNNTNKSFMRNLIINSALLGSIAAVVFLVLQMKK
jgi:hypothetical protein